LSRQSRWPTAFIEQALWVVNPSRVLTLRLTGKALSLGAFTPRGIPAVKALLISIPKQNPLILSRISQRKLSAIIETLE